MESQRRVLCPENEELAIFMWTKRKEMVDPKKGISERIDSTLNKAYRNLCDTKTPIKTLKEFSQIKGVGKWIVRLMNDFFKKDIDDDDPGVEDISNKGKEKSKGTRRYVPQKKTVSYALLITLYREKANGRDFMKKQELIDAAELSGLSRVPIAAELGKGKQGQFGGSAREWYSGWTAMTTLITKGLVVKSSNPAKYMLTQEGQEAARECLLRSGLADCIDNLDTIGNFPNKDPQNASDLDTYRTLSGEMTVQSVNLRNQEESLNLPEEYLEKLTLMGYSVEQICSAFAKVSHDTLSKDISSLLPAVIHHLQKDQVDVLLSVCRQTSGKGSHATLNTYNVPNVGRAGSFVEENGRTSCGGSRHGPDSLNSAESGKSSFTLQACSSSDYRVHTSTNHEAAHTSINVLMVPPLRPREKFGDVYDVILILDDREQFVNSNKGYHSRKLENMRTEFKLQVEVRRLPVGDAIWIARHKQHEDEYVLDFIVERKEVQDLRCSIQDNRYRDQKLRILRCGLQKIIYIVEGDPNASEAAESIKTACFTTEILEGFDVQRTSGLGDTLRKYGYLTIAITHLYRVLPSSDNNRKTRTCPSFDDFIKKCEDLEKMTVNDVFAIQLMQVPQVTEEIALAVLALHPTVVSLARAYSLLDGDIRTQEDMLMTQSNNMISRVASKNIFKLVWSS